MFLCKIIDPVLKTFLKYQKQPSIHAIKQKLSSKSSFTFHHVERNEILKQIKILNKSKAIHGQDLPTKIIQENV